MTAHYHIALCQDRKSGAVAHKSLSWTAFAERLCRCTRTDETFEAYLAMSKRQQAAIKDVGGYVAGTFKGFRRLVERQQDRCMLTLDIDEPGIPWQQLRLHVRGQLFGLTYACHTTHKHCAPKPRIRIVVPLTRPVNELEHEALARALASDLDPAMHWVDRCSFDFCRLMYWPSAAVDGEFVAWHEEGALLDPDDVLAAAYPNGVDPAYFPRKHEEDDAPHIAARTREDPREKRGLIGKFCRLYDIERVLDELLPGVYEPSRAQGRYTYSGGTTEGGARLYHLSDGFAAFLHSEHDHDPARGQNNAWDLVRLHKAYDDESMEAWARLLPDVAAALRGEIEGEFDPVPDDQVGVSRFAWLEGWVFVTGQNRFFRLDARTPPISRDAFNALYQREAGKACGREKSGRPTLCATDIAMDRALTCVDALRYRPGADSLFDIDGVRYANSYRAAGIPSVGNGGRTPAVSAMQTHLANLFGEHARELMLDFLAHCLRYPGQRLHYAMLVRGAELDGKSWIAALMHRLLGESNWITLGNDQIKEQYNGWIEGHLFAAIEEIKQDGHDATDVLNRLKNLVTNDIVQVRKMRQDVTSCDNFCNLYLTTNYSGALPLSDADSRFCVLSTRFSHKDEVLAWSAEWAANNSGRDFYAELWAMLKDRNAMGQVRAWLEARPFSVWYKPHQRAPHTSAKAAMIRTGKSPVDELLDELLDDPMVPAVCRQFVVWPEFTRLALLANVSLPLSLQGRGVATFMDRNGFGVRVRVRVRNSEQVSVWLRHSGEGDSHTSGISPALRQKIADAVDFTRQGNHD